MNPRLQRIGATLGQIIPTDRTGARPSAQERVDAARAEKKSAPKPDGTARRLQPFPITNPSAAGPTSAPVAPPSPQPSPRSSLAEGAVKPFTAQEGRAKSLPRPKNKPPSFSSHKHSPNPNLAVGLLQEIETQVIQWQLELEQIVLEIQALYLEGPIVDGWLESSAFDPPPTDPPPGVATLRHAEVEELMSYVEALCQAQPTSPSELSRSGGRTEYRLCGLGEDGQVWSRPCPAQQVPYVGLAIARYQKLRTLLAQKQTLENRLTQLVESLTRVHSQIQVN